MNVKALGWVVAVAMVVSVVIVLSKGGDENRGAGSNAALGDHSQVGQNPPVRTEEQRKRRQERKAAQAGATNGKEAKGTKGQGKERQTDKGNRPVKVQEGVPGTENIVVLAGGKETGFKGSDLQGLEQVAVASKRGVRKGWPAESVMKHVGVAEAKELFFEGKDGETYSLSWDKLKDPKVTVILAYNRMGGLMLTSGHPLSLERLETVSRGDVRAMTQKKLEGRVFFTNIVKIEAKKG